MPVPFNDVTAAMRLGAERTENALRKVLDICFVCINFITLWLKVHFSYKIGCVWLTRLHPYCCVKNAVANQTWLVADYAA